MENRVYSKTFLWMFIGLLVTFLTGLYTSNNIDALSVIFTKGGYWVLVILEIVLAIFLGVRIHKMNPTTAKVVFLLYAFISGLTFSALFIVYKVSSIIMVFGVTSALFLIFALIGKYTKIDLSRIGTFLLMMLIGVIVLGIVNMFIGSSMLTTLISCLSLVVFLGYTAYDINKIKQMMNYKGDKEQNLAIIGAFSLFLDYIHIFIDLLNLLGGNSRD